MAISNIKSLTEKFKASQGIATNKEAEAAVRTLVQHLVDTIVEDGVLSIPGFGTFTVKDTAARTGRSPSTGEPLEIAASKRLGFKAARGLKDAITATV